MIFESNFKNLTNILLKISENIINLHTWNGEETQNEFRCGLDEWEMQNARDFQSVLVKILSNLRKNGI